jgi:hypothetical protein
MVHSGSAERIRALLQDAVSALGKYRAPPISWRKKIVMNGKPNKCSPSQGFLRGRLRPWASQNHCWLMAAAISIPGSLLPIHTCRGTDLPPPAKSALRPSPRPRQRPMVVKSFSYLLTGTRQFNILQSGPGWRGSNAIRSTETTRVHHAARRRCGVASRDARGYRLRAL